MFKSFVKLMVFWAVMFCVATLILGTKFFFGEAFYAELLSSVARTGSFHLVLVVIEFALMQFGILYLVQKVDDNRIKNRFLYYALYGYMNLFKDLRII